MAGAVAERIRYAQTIRFTSVHNLRSVWRQMSVMRNDNFVGSCNQTPLSGSIECEYRGYALVFASYCEHPVLGRDGLGQA